MRGMFRKTITAAAAALTLGAVTMTATPSQARHVWVRGWHHGHNRHGGYYGSGGGLGALDAFALFGPAALPYAFGAPCLQYSPVYDAYGRYIGRRVVNVCR